MKHRGNRAIGAAVFALTGILPFAPGLAVGDTTARIGILGFDARHCSSPPFLEGLRELGYNEGRNITIECRHADGRYEALLTAAEALARSRPAVIVALNHDWALAAQRATNDIPLVIISSGEPVASGFVASLARPGGNVTGLTYFATELNAKRLEFLKIVVPNLKRVAVLKNPKSTPALVDAYLREIRAAAASFGIEIMIVDAGDEAELELAFEQIVAGGAQAVFILATRVFAEMAPRIADLAKWNNLPSVHFHKRYPPLGGLMSYAPDYDLLHRRTAVYVDKILKGAKPADLPVEQPERFELRINKTTARELGLTIPASLLLRADRVIEEQ